MTGVPIQRRDEDDTNTWVTNEDLVRRQPKRERPQKKPTLPAPQSWTSSIQNSEKTQSLCKSRSLWSFVIAAQTSAKLKNEQTNNNNNNKLHTHKSPTKF